MAMKESHTINAPIDKVLEAFTSEDFARHVAKKAGVEFESLNVDGETSGAFTVTTVRGVGADKVPSVAQKFVGNAVREASRRRSTSPECRSRRARTRISPPGRADRRRRRGRGQGQLFPWSARRSPPPPSRTSARPCPSRARPPRTGSRTTADPSPSLAAPPGHPIQPRRHTRFGGVPGGAVSVRADPHDLAP
jgi:hypothetical protein